MSRLSELRSRLAFFAELKRRRVYRVAAVYGAVAFVLWQIADIVVPALYLPEWTLTLIVVLGLLGFPVAVVLAWAFDITPEGVRRTGGGSGGPPGEKGEPASATPLVDSGVLVLGVVVLLVAGGVGLWVTTSRGEGGAMATAPGSVGAPGQEPTVAVIPFTNLSDERENEYFSDGIAEDILTALAGFEGLRVISRTSTMRYKDTEKSVPEIAGELGATAIVEGSVRRAGNRVLVTAQLIDAGTDAHLWADRFERTLTADAIFEIQAEVARRIADALRVTLAPEERERLAAMPTSDVTAYDYYVRGRSYLSEGTGPGTENGAQMMERALELDPEYALAHAGLAVAYVFRSFFQAESGWLDSAVVAAEHALALDPDLPEAHRALGRVYQELAVTPARSDSAAALNHRALERYRRALELRPSYAEAMGDLSRILGRLGGDVEERLRWARRAAELEPLSGEAANRMGRLYLYNVGAVDAAEHWLRQALQVQPEFAWPHGDLVWLHLFRGELDGAEEHARLWGSGVWQTEETSLLRTVLLHRGDLEAALAMHARQRERWNERNPESPSEPGVEEGFILLRLDERERAEEIFRRRLEQTEREIEAEGESGYHHLEMGRIHAIRGDRDASLRHLERFVDLTDTGGAYLHLRPDPMLDGLRREPRFRELMRRLEHQIEQDVRKLEEAGLL